MYSVANLCDPRVFAVFEAKLKDCQQEKLDKVLQRVDTLYKAGKQLERAMADALQELKLV